MDEPDFKAPRRTRIGVFVAVALLHVVVILALIRAFAPDFVAQTTKAVVSAFEVTITAPQPPTVTPSSAEPEGAAAEAGKKVKPKEVIATKPKIPVKAVPAPQASSNGNAATSGATNSGAGSGAEGNGNGTGSGGSGDGMGASQARKAEKVAGTIDNARDYSRDGRERRLGNSVTVFYTVGVDGRVSDCRVTRSSGDPESDARTCELVVQRFRYRPAQDRWGNPISSVTGWNQRFFTPH